MSLVQTSRIGGALQLTITRPAKRNALDFATLRALAAALEAARQDADLRFLVLTAAGDKAFCAGGDLLEYGGLRSREATLAMSIEYRGALDGLRQFPVPVIAALNGDALGGGAELAMACDLRVAAAHARIGFLQGGLGITTAWGGGADLIDAVGRSRALQLLASSEILDAAAALRIGLLHAVAGAGEPLADCLARFCEPFQQRLPQVMRGFKALAVAHAAGMDRAGIRAVELAHLVETWTHPDHWQAVEASKGKAGKR